VNIVGDATAGKAREKSERSVVLWIRGRSFMATRSDREVRTEIAAAASQSSVPRVARPRAVRTREPRQAQTIAQGVGQPIAALQHDSVDRVQAARTAARLVTVGQRALSHAQARADERARP